MTMHIAYVCADSGIPVFGAKGGSIHVQEILTALLRKGHRITLFCAKRGGPAPKHLAAVECIDIPLVGDQHDPLFESSVNNLQAELKRALTDLDAVDLVYERYSLWSYAGMETASRLGIPSCLEVNSYLIEEQSRYRELVHANLAQQCFTRVITSANTIYTVSEGVRARLRAAGITNKPLHVIHNGVDTERFRRRDSSIDGITMVSSSQITIGFCGSLKPWHGVVDLIEAFEMHRHSHSASQLKIVGDGPERARIEERINILNLGDAVQMIGAVPADQVPEALESVDVAVAPYPRLESMYFSPLKVFEYLALEICTIASRIGDIPDLIEHNVSGILYDPGNVWELAQILDDLAQDRERMKAIAAAGRKVAVSKHTWDQVADRFMGLVFGPLR